MNDESDEHCPLENLCRRKCTDYELCLRETLETGVNRFGQIITHPHMKALYEGRRWKAKTKKRWTIWKRLLAAWSPGIILLLIFFFIWLYFTTTQSAPW